jgi:hypothetical protein
MVKKAWAQIFNKFSFLIGFQGLYIIYGMKIRNLGTEFTEFCDN